MIVKFKLTPYHLVENSLHPAIVSLALFNSAVSLISSIAGIWNSNTVLSVLCVSISIIIWLLDINLESNYYGYHTNRVQTGLNIGFILFVISEIALFFSLFWAYLHNSLVPTVDIGSIWPPYCINPIYPYDIALYGTLLLFSSSITLTVSHYAFIYSDLEFTIYYMILTIVLGMIFTRVQAFEYNYAPFSLVDSAYSSSFYILTGLHGIHVVLGTIMLITSLYNIVTSNCRTQGHLGFKFSILYWHFVDVLWFFVYSILYVLPYVTGISMGSVLDSPIPNITPEVQTQIKKLESDRIEWMEELKIIDKSKEVVDGYKLAKKSYVDAEIMKIDRTLLKLRVGDSNSNSNSKESGESDIK